MGRLTTRRRTDHRHRPDRRSLTILVRCNIAGWLSIVQALALAWDVGSRRWAGAERPYRTWSVRDLPAWFGSFVVLPVVVYTLSWTGWFVTSTGFDRKHKGGVPALC